jgi:hypothetical protein
MFGTIRRHQSWLLVLIIGATIISFVVYFQPGSQSSNAGAAQVLELNGKPVTPRMIAEARNEIRLIYFLNTRKWPEEDPEAAKYDFDDDALVRLFRVSKAEEAGIRISDETVAEMARRFLGTMPLDQFLKEMATRNITADDFERFMRHEAMFRQLSSVVGAAGQLITPAEAEAVYRREHQEVGGDIVFINLTNYLSKVVVTNGALTNWYAMRGYRTPDRVQVSYVQFSRTNFIPEVEKRFEEVTNLTQQLREMYYKAGPANFKDTNGNLMSESNALVEIRETQRDRSAMMLALRKANDFANQLYDKQPVTVESFMALAASNNLPVKVTPPFDRENGFTNLNVSPKFTEIAFSLNASNNPVAVQPIEGEDGFYIIALKEMIPSQPEPFTEIAAKVEEDYKRYQAYTLAFSAATNFIAKATNALAQGKTFEEVAQTEGLKFETLPPISMQTESLTNLQERLDVQQLKNVMLSMEPGKVSGFRQNPPHGGYVVYVRGKLPFDEAKLRAELPQVLAEMRAQKQNEIFNQWLYKQEQAAKLPTKRQMRAGPG